MYTRCQRTRLQARHSTVCKVPCQSGRDSVASRRGRSRCPTTHKSLHSAAMGGSDGTDVRAASAQCANGVSASSSLMTSIPIAVFCDSYKATHPKQYPACTEMVAYGEFRRGYDKDKEDTRMVHYGIRYIIETYLHRQWTARDLELAASFYSTHCAGGTALPWPKELFQRIVSDHNGYFPITIEALPEGTCTNVHVPPYQITARGDFAPLCLFFETLLTQIWYPSTVATLSRRARDVIEAAFDRGADGGAQHPLVASRLHDFGMRGCCTGEQAVLGGCAHLLSFEGTDTMPAAFHAQYNLNNGEPVGFSIPATVRCTFATFALHSLYWLACSVQPCHVLTTDALPTRTLDGRFRTLA